MNGALPTGGPTPNPRAQTLPLQGLVNQLVRGLLRVPLLCRLVGRRLITLYVIGRKSGRQYGIPVAYTRQQGVLLVGTQVLDAKPAIWRTGRRPSARQAAVGRGSDSG